MWQIVVECQNGVLTDEQDDDQLRRRSACCPVHVVDLYCCFASTPHHYFSARLALRLVPETSKLVENKFNN